MSNLEKRLEAILKRDIHGGTDGKYRIHSLYFDDLKDRFVRENDAGISERVKYRIRYYDERQDVMKLERKEKREGRCHKESCIISLEEYRKIMEKHADEVLWQTDNLLLKQFCMQCMAGKLLPKAVIDFERTAFVEDITNIRITLDQNISVSDNLSRFAEGNYIRYPIQEKGQGILEVKFDAILPGYIRHIVTGRGYTLTSFSKYVLGRKKLQQMGK